MARLRYVRFAVWAAAAFAAAGCVQLSTGDPTSTGSSAGSPSSGGGTTGGVGDGGAAGTGCSADPQTGTVLCSGVVGCPGLAIDPSAWPSCGFRDTGGTSLDLECLCGDSLCPIGVATSCGQASQLLSQQNQLMVCSQIAEQRCVAVPATAVTGAGQDAGGGVPSTCNQQCIVGCGAAADCLQVCGC
ncbi:MAG: hypothetical protein ACRENE_19435 [Polyangiaceae bacterium]